MNMLKKGFSLILVLLILLPCVISCRNDHGNSGDPASSQSSSSSDVVDDNKETEPDKYDVTDDVGTRDYGGRDIKLGYVNSGKLEVDIVPERMSGDIVKDSLFKRNATVESRLGIKIVNYVSPGQNLVSDLRNTAESGTAPFDIMFGRLYITATAIQEGFFHNLNECEDINFDNKYWGNYANQAMEIGGVLNMASGPISLTYYSDTFCTAVNDRILASAKDGEVPDLIKVVDDGDWTLEYQTKLANKYYFDQGDAGKDDDDIAGYYSAAYSSHHDCYLPGLNIKIVTKDSNGYLKFDVDLDRMSSAIDKIGELHAAAGTVLTDEADPLAAMRTAFGSGHALMVQVRLYDILQLDDMSDPYTILPVPKFDKDQDKYYSSIHDSSVGVSLVSTVLEEDVQMMGAVIEVMASESYRQVTPVFYETVLKVRSLDDPDNWRIIDEMMANATLDPSTPYGNIIKVGYSPVGWWRRIIRDMVNSGSNTTSSIFNETRTSGMKDIIEGEKGLNAYFKSLNQTNE